MRLIKNSGNDRVIDELRQCLSEKSLLDIASPEFSLFAFAELQDLLANLGQVRLALPSSDYNDWSILGKEVDRAFRNRLQNQAYFRSPSMKGVWILLSIFSSKFKKPLTFGAMAFFPRFISVQHLVSSRTPMNGSLVKANRSQNQAELSGRVFLIGSLC